MAEYFYYGVDKLETLCTPVELKSSRTEFNGKELLEYVIFPGIYGHDTALIRFTPEMTHNIHDYPFMAISYLANSNSLKLDVSITYTDSTGSNESWTERRPPLEHDKNINALVYDVRNTDAVCFPTRDYESYSYLIKPFGGHIGAITKERSFAICYIAFFKTEEEAKKFNLENLPEKIVYEDTTDPTKLDRVPAFARKYYGNTPVTVLNGQDFADNVCLAPRTHELDVELCENGAMRFITNPGFYMCDQNAVKISSSGMNFSPRVYSYVNIAYKNTGSDDFEVRLVWDRTQCEYQKLEPSAKTDGYDVAVFDINKLSPEKISAKYNNITLYFRNCDLENKTATETVSTEILYIAFFENEDSAKSFKYEGAKTVKKTSEAVSANFIQKDDFTVADKYIKEADELKEKITNSANNYEMSEYGTTYYVSSINGSDENDGLSKDTPFKTCKRFMGTLKPCDYVLFERGSLFRECIKMEKGVTYSAYGVGEKPRFYNSYDASGADKWTLTDKENVWVYNTDIPAKEDIGNIVFDGGRAWGIKAIKNKNGDRIHQGYCYNGFELVNAIAEKFSGYMDMKYNLEYFHDWNAGKLYLCCNFGNPGEYFKEIELSKKGCTFSNNASGCVLDNLCIKYTGSHGVGTGNFSDFIVQYCEFGWIGGSIQGSEYGMTSRFGNAVECFGSAENYIIHDCYAYQVYDCCYTTQWQGGMNSDVVMNGIRFYNNVAELSNTGLETWLACHMLYTDNQYKFRNMELFNNYNLYMGYGWSHQRLYNDSNFFFGDYLISDTYYENCSIHHNVNVYTWQSATFARYIGKRGFNFHDNIYVIERDRDFARTSSTPTDGSGRMTSFRADKDGMDLLLRHTVEENSIIYSVPENCCVNDVAKALYEAEGTHSYSCGARCSKYDK